MTAPPTTPSTEEPTETLPARIGVQVRDGFVNELHAFELRVYETSPVGDGDEARLSHRIDIRDIMVALAAAQHELILDLREQFKDDVEATAEYNQWFADLTEWAVRP